MSATALPLDVSPSYATSVLSQLLAYYASGVSGASSSKIFKVAEPTIRDRWFEKTLGVLEAYRHYSAGWDGLAAKAPDKGSLLTAEYLTALFATWPSPRRPQLALDVDGRPTFGAKTGNYYLHLTVDAPGVLTWYATKDADEFFQDEVKFAGAALPAELEILAK